MLVNVPNPSRFVSHRRVEDVASDCHRHFVEEHGAGASEVDPEAFLDLFLGVGIVWDRVDEPSGAVVLAAYEEEDGSGRVIVNETHRSFLEDHAEILRSSLGHEAGHCVLKHYGVLNGDRTSAPLFRVAEEPRRLYHKSSWIFDSLSRADVADLRRVAALDETARTLLLLVDDTFEPLWMYQQAQHFSMSLLIPRDSLSALLEDSWNFNGWSSIYELARHFRVSPSMMRVRLTKLGIITIGTDGRPSPGDALKQPRLL